jgi:hypothetical protein
MPQFLQPVSGRAGHAHRMKTHRAMRPTRLPGFVDPIRYVMLPGNAFDFPLIKRRPDRPHDRHAQRCAE